MDGLQHIETFGDGLDVIRLPVEGHCGDGRRIPEGIAQQDFVKLDVYSWEGVQIILKSYLPILLF